MQTTSLLNEYFAPAELAAELNVCPKTLDRWRIEGTGPPITKIGRRTYYSRSGVATWLRTREKRSRTAPDVQHSTA
jgi:hypothetical protein